MAETESEMSEMASLAGNFADSEATFHVRQIGVVTRTNYGCTDRRRVEYWRRLRTSGVRRADEETRRISTADAEMSQSLEALRARRQIPHASATLCRGVDDHASATIN